MAKRTNETFDDSEDEFFAGRDEVLLNDEPATKRRRDQGRDIANLNAPADIFPERDLQPSDEEVLNEDWDDYYGADVIETEADAHEEEVEARRLRTKQLQSMTDVDFGIQDWNEVGPVVEKLPEVVPVTVEEKLAVLHTRYPEFAPLVQEFQELSSLRVEGMKLQALQSYLAAIAMYFAVMSVGHVEMKEHAIINTLIRTRRVWEVVKIQKTPVHATQKLQTIPTRAADKPRNIQVNAATATADKRLKIPANAATITTDKRPKISNGEANKIDLQDLLDASEESDFGDETLTAAQVADKASKRKSLRFYSAQIAQKSGKRGAASREAGGDDDVPQKERRERVIRRVDGEGQDEFSDASVEVEQEIVMEKPVERVMEEEAGRKRGITYAIEKNKGLMPKRNKDVRNPRVKKKKKYEEKMKKLGSIRPVYKGGKGGNYSGELTGIKMNVIKSVKLG